MGVIKKMTKASRNWLVELEEETEKHLSTDSMYNYIFNSKEITVDEKKHIEGHLAECSRCNSQVREVDSRKEFYLSVPSIFDI